ncbi:MAG: (deoxy)nucleoside triphosphate pyrophosphohydrolase [Clostridia bacterium]|jgi:8-oxo-dGTP diphosphatase|nr:NUDIX domain-containing protein [Spirochaetia bacterium]
MPRSVAGIAIKDGLALVARRLPGGEMGGTWEFPGGKLESGEDDEQALIREFDEEFGVAVKVGRKLGQAWFEHSGKHYDLAAVMIELEQGPLELREHSETRWVGSTEITELRLSDSDRSLLPFVMHLLR